MSPSLQAGRGSPLWVTGLGLEFSASPRLSCWSVRGCVQGWPSQSGGRPAEGPEEEAGGGRERAPPDCISRVLHNWCWALPGVWGGSARQPPSSGGGGMGRPGRTSDVQLDCPPAPLLPPGPPLQDDPRGPCAHFLLPPQSLPLPCQGSGGQDRVTHAASAWPYSSEDCPHEPCSWPTPETPAS